MKIEPLRDGCCDDAVNLWSETGLTRPWNDARADLRRARRGAASTVLAGMDGECLIATVMVGHDGHRGWVYYLGVRQDARGRGHGRAMMEAAEAWLRARDIPKLNLMVRSDNETAGAFYRAIGYGIDEVTVLSRRLDEHPA